MVSQPPIEDLVAALDLEGHARRGGLTGRRLAAFLDRYLASATRLHHPGYMAHQVAVPHPAGALASLVDGFTNNAMAIYEMGPSAAAIEFWVLNWMIGKIGWTPTPYPRDAQSAEPHAGGVLTHGGSLANLTALLAARSAVAPEAWERGTPPDLALLVPAESHYSVARAAGILGLGSAAIYALDVDSAGRILPDRITACLRRVREDDRRPMALVANACSTALGLYDRLQGDRHDLPRAWTLAARRRRPRGKRAPQRPASFPAGRRRAGGLPGLGCAQADAHADPLRRGASP